MKTVLAIWAVAAVAVVIVFSALSTFNRRMSERHRWSDEELRKLGLR
jgi:hypothetical protein